MTAGQPVQAATNQLLAIQKQQAGTQQPNIPVSASPNQDIVINNKTENITRNKVYVPANIGGPIQGRPIQFRQQEAKAEQDLGKFKSWLNNQMATQNELSEARQREYRKRNVSLEKSHNKLSRILSDFGKRIDSGLNQRSQGLGLTFKNVLLLFGLARLATHWGETISTIDRINKGIGSAFESLKVDFKSGFSRNGKFTKALVKLFGGKEGETPGQAFRKLFFDKDTGILAYIRKVLNNRIKERSEAISKIEKPDINFWSLFSPSKAIGELARYLSDILSAILSPGKTAGRIAVDAVNTKTENYVENYQSILREASVQNYTNLVGNKKVSENDRAIMNGTYAGLKADAIDRRGELTDVASSYVSQSMDIRRNILSSQNGNINTASVGVGFSRLYQAAQKKDKIPVTVDFINTFAPDKESRAKLGIQEEPVSYNYIIRQKTDKEMAYDLYRIGQENEELRSFINGLGGIVGLIGSGFNPFGGALGMQFGYYTGKFIEDMKKAGLPTYTTELRSPELPVAEGEQVSEEHPLVYELTKEQIENLVAGFTGKSGLEINIDNHEFMSAIDARLRNIAGSPENIRSSELGDINSLYSVNSMMEQNRADEAAFLENSRVNSMVQNGNEAFHEMGNYIRETANNAREAFRDGSDNLTIGGGSRSNDNITNDGSDGNDENPSLWDRAVETWDNMRAGWSSTGSSISSASPDDMDRVVAISKTGYFYSDGADTGSDGKGVRGKKGPWSKNGHGYLELGTGKYKGKCTSGPATFYHDALGINLNGHWWKGGRSYYDAVGTNIDKVGFRKVWWGTKEQGSTRQGVEATGFKLEKGDIMLNFVHNLPVSNSHPRVSGYENGCSAHAQMWNGEQWVSDTYQGDRSWPYGKDSKGKFGNESCQIWRFLPNTPIQTEEVAYNPSQQPSVQTATPAQSVSYSVPVQTPVEITTPKPTSDVPLIYNLEPINNLNSNSYLPSYDFSQNISNFELVDNINSNLASLTLTARNTAISQKEKYDKIVDIAYNSLDSIAGKLNVVIQNEAINADATNDISNNIV